MEKIKLEKLNKNCIYGAIGVTQHDDFGLRKGYKTTFTITWGHILQGNNDFNFREYGKKFLCKKNVDTLDCCCLMIHSSLIKKYCLRFDENLSFHMYAEDLCYSAKLIHKIQSKVVPMKCFHMGTGNLDEEFFKSSNYLKEKFHIDRIPSTCKN